MMVMQHSIEENEGELMGMHQVEKEALRFIQKRLHLLSNYPKNFDATDVLDSNITALVAQKKDQEQPFSKSRISVIETFSNSSIGGPLDVRKEILMKLEEDKLLLKAVPVMTLVSSSKSALGCKGGLGIGKLEINDIGGGGGHGGKAGDGFYNGTLVKGGSTYGSVTLPCELGSGWGNDTLKENKHTLLWCSRESKVRGGKLLLNGRPPYVRSNASLKPNSTNHKLLPSQLQALKTTIHALEPGMPEVVSSTTWRRSAHKLWVKRHLPTSSLPELLRVVTIFVGAINEGWLYECASSGVT